MASAYPEFHGRKNEDVEDFLEKMEVACISNHVEAPAHMLRLLQICLKGDARAWSKTHEEGLQRADPAVPLTWDNLRQALATQFAKVEDADKVWHEIQGLRQGEAKSIDDYGRKFSLLWERLCRALQPAVAPPDMMKKDRFMAGLCDTLRWRVELKKPKTYEDTLEVAKNKEWKIKRMSQLGVEALPKGPETKQVRFLDTRIPEEVHHHVHAVAPVVTPVMPVVPTASVQDDGLRQEVRQVVDLMKNLSLNFLGNAQGRGRQYNQPANDGGQGRNGSGSNSGRGWRKIPTCYNCGELGHISPQCDKPPRMGGDMYPLPAQLPNRANDYGIEIRGEAGPSGLIVDEKGKAKMLNVVCLKRKTTVDEPMVMPVRKRDTAEKERRDEARPSKKKGKSHEGKDVKAKRKRRARRKFHVSDFPLGDGQESYSLREDLTSRKADVTFGQLVEMVPKLKRQWKKLVNPREKETER